MAQVTFSCWWQNLFRVSQCFGEEKLDCLTGGSILCYGSSGLQNSNSFLKASKSMSIPTFSARSRRPSCEKTRRRVS